MTKTYKDYCSYEEYEKLQKETLRSFESDHEKYLLGQERAIDSLFTMGCIQPTYKVLDCACGDGVGLRKFRALGFTDVVGVEFSPEKAERADKYGYPVHRLDFHDLATFDDSTFDVVYSSHSLEHAYYPHQAIDELVRVLKSRGTMIVILPYPDHQTNGGHEGRHELGSYVVDEACTVERTFNKHGLITFRKMFDHYREPEVWFIFHKEDKFCPPMGPIG